MLSLFINEFFGSLMQLVLFSLIPFIWWLIAARKKMNFFSWVGLKKITHTGKWIYTVLASVAALLVYGFLTSLFIKMFSEGVTSAGSNFAGKGIQAIPAVIAYGFIRTGLSEELLFRGFILKRISEKFGFIAGNTVQAILFGLIHGVPFGIATSNILVTVMLTILPGAFGWYQGWLNEKRCDGSIIPSWLIHGTLNVIVACISL